ncbi:MAG: hypothetical protein HY211_00740 [Candidatus Omnitrophica bacterium]|nr:hypothetical protein [Candidatus Omnitrophota bacterium]
MDRDIFGLTLLDRLAELRRYEATLMEIEAGLARMLDKMESGRAAPLRRLLEETIALRRQHIEEEYKRVISY